jgi:P-type Ca2+ transporter type 2C
LGQFEDVLRPDPGTEPDFQVERNPFAYSPGQLNKLLNPKSLPALVALGGLPGLERGLRTDINAGLSADEVSLHGSISFKEAVDYRSKNGNLQDITPQLNIIRTESHSINKSSPAAFTDRIRVFEKNEIPAKKAISLWKLMWMAYNDRVLILLTAAAVISLALGVSI